jgi:hypothetical protein
VEDDRFKADLAEMIDQADTKYTEFVKLDKSAKSTKKSWEAMVDEILAMGRKSKEEHPLFDGKDEVNAAFVSDGETVDADFSLKQIDGPVLPDEHTASSDDSWKAIEVSELCRHGLADSVITKLYDAGMSTIGAMADWSKSGKQLTGLPGIGESKAGEINDALESFWSQWQPKKSRKKTA